MTLSLGCCPSIEDYREDGPLILELLDEKPWLVGKANGKVKYIYIYTRPSFSRASAWVGMCATHDCKVVVIFSIQPDDPSWAEMTLATSRGGLSLRTTLQHASAAYIASVDESHALAKKIYPTYQPIALPQTCTHLNTLVDPLAKVDAATIPHSGTPPLKQKDLSTRIEEASLKAITKAATPAKRARLLSLQQPGTSSWLNSPPDPALGHRMPPLEFRCYVKYRFGLPIIAPSPACPLCKEPQDSFGHHALKCKSSGDRIRRHNNLRNRFHNLAQQALMAPRIEVPRLIPDNGHKPADVLLPAYSSGKAACLDFAVTSTAQDRLLPQAATDPFYACKTAEKLKLHKHKLACDQEDLIFIPMVVDNWGVWGQQSKDTFERVARALSVAQRKPHKETLRRIRDDLNNLLAVANAHMIAARFPAARTCPKN